jgi:hypothetical protein
MLSLFLRSSSEVIKVCEDDMSQIVKNVCHGPLERDVGILEAEWHDTICAPRGRQCGFVLIGKVNLDLVVTRETVHEGQSLVTCAIIDYLVDEGCWKVVFGIGMIEVTKVHIDTDSALFFVNKDRVGDP